MEKKYILDIVVNKEKLSNGSNVFVAHCSSLGVSSQGSNFEEAMKMIKEAVELYLEEMPEKYEELEIEKNSLPVFSVIEVERNDKTTNIIG